MNRRSRHLGFTLIELLVVIAIIIVLISILVPALANAREQSKSIYCRTNLRQFAQAAHIYALENQEYLPLGYLPNPVQQGTVWYNVAWDFIHAADTATGRQWIKPGLLWQDIDAPEKIQQCPSFDGPANWLDDPTTGYNYNASYIGEPDALDLSQQVRISEINTPAACALFGDGQYADGANKMMRAPLIDVNDATQRDYYFGSRAAGAQGFRHNGATNVAWADGHVTAQRERFANTLPDQQDLLTENIGFLSFDNRAYDLK